MKYIIEFEDEPYMREDGVDYYTCKSARWYKLGETIINRLTPYTEPDRKAIEDEVWEFFGYICRMSSEEGDLCFGFSSMREVTINMTYQEAKAKYEAWLEQKDEIHYGDEIISVDDDVKAVMLDCADYESIYVMTENGCVERWKDLDGVKKTGRHFPEVGELLDKMRGEEE